jgi:hypothetical protein
MRPVPTAPRTDPTLDAGQRPRLELKPASRTATGHVDGAWWPRSRDLRAELPALLEVLAARLGRIERVNYPLADWTEPARRTVVAGALVHLSGYRSQPAGTLDVVTASGRTTLLVVPPETDPGLAQRALAAAARQGDTTEVTGFLPGPAAAPAAAPA